MSPRSWSRCEFHLPALGDPQRNNLMPLDWTNSWFQLLQNNIFWSNFCWMIENLRPLFDKGVCSKFKCSQGLVCKQFKIASKSFCSSWTPRHLDKSSIWRMLFPSNAWSTWMMSAGISIALSDSCCMVRLVRSIFATSLACSGHTRQNSSVVRVLLSWWPEASSGEKTANNLFNLLGSQ